MPSSYRLLSLCIHFWGFISSTRAFLYLFHRPGRSGIDHFIFHFQWLTNVALLISFLAFTLGLISDILRKQILQVTKRKLLFLSAPLEATITIAYWSIYLYHPSLIVDSRVHGTMPFDIDLNFHFWPGVLLLSDYILLTPPRSVPRSHSFAAFAFLSSSYWMWIQHGYKVYGRWPYPILGYLSLGHRLCGLIVMTALLWGLSIGMQKFRKEIWALNLEQETF